MKRLAKLATLSLTAGMLLAACGDVDETDDTLPGTEDPAEDDGMMDDDLDDADGIDDPDEEGGLDDERDDEDGIYGDEDELEDEELDDDMDDDE